MADISLAGSVGLGATNGANDVRKVQELLNAVPPEWGGPNPKLKVDGISGSLTRAAILAFQTFQLGTMIKPDSRVDPRGKTLARLNAIANTSERPSQSVFATAGAVKHERQPTNLVCWAAAGTMLVNARDGMVKDILTVMVEADAKDEEPDYVGKFVSNTPLQPNETGRYTQALGLKVEPPISFTVGGWLRLMRRHGALGVVEFKSFLHIRVVRQMQGDGTVFGTLVTLSDPLLAQPITEVFMSFVQRYEAAAPAGTTGFFQIWHR